MMEAQVQDQVVSVDTNVQAAESVQIEKPRVSKRDLLQTYVDLWNEAFAKAPEGSDPDVTLQDVAEVLDMEVSNVYQRVRELRKAIEAAGGELPMMKRSREAHKSATRTNLGELLNIAGMIRTAK
jgi:hypothetical protein